MPPIALGGRALSEPLEKSGVGPGAVADEEPLGSGDGIPAASRAPVSASAVITGGFDREKAEARLIELLAEANALALWLGYPPFVLPPTSSFRGRA